MAKTKRYRVSVLIVKDFEMTVKAKSKAEAVRLAKTRAMKQPVKNTWFDKDNTEVIAEE